MGVWPHTQPHSPAIPQIRDGRVRALAVTSLERSPAFPELPTVAESAIPGFDVGSWFAMFAPARTPRDVVQNINSAVRTVLHARPLQSAFTSLGARVVGSTPRELGQHLESEMRKSLAFTASFSAHRRNF